MMSGRCKPSGEGVSGRGGRFMRAVAAAMLCLAAGVASVGAQDAKAPKRLRRADSFLGMHFDFHANQDDKAIGRNTTRAMVESIIDQVHPDYIQVDCKGHPGFSSYPTKVGNPAGSFVGDPLRVWREVTAERGVALFMHYSGVLDGEAVRRHPDWAALRADGKPDARATSVFGPYADKLLIPQLKELAGAYGVDGVWVDGDCWGTIPDYGARAMARLRERTGLSAAPRKPGDPHWYEFMQFHRAAFREYLAHYVTEVKRAHPDFQICSNWAFSDHMPEPVSAPVDFLSGDFMSTDSVNSARLAGRCLARQGKPWDLMAWSFARPEKGQSGKPAPQRQKTAVQLKREAAVVLALGGGFQAYFKQQRDGSIHPEQMPVMAEVARFCRERQAVCHRAESVPQVALLYSTAAISRISPNVYSPRGKLGDLNGVLQALLESQYAVDVVSEHHLEGRLLSSYPLVVIPDWEYLEPEFKASLKSYVQLGGALLLVGPKAAALFAEETGAPEKGKAMSVTKLGSGRIAAIPEPLGLEYSKAPSAAKRDLLAGVVRELFPMPRVVVEGSHSVDVSVMRKDGNLLVNLVNTSGPHRTEPIIDSIPPVGPLKVTIRNVGMPGKVTLQPSGRELAYDYHTGAIEIELPRLEIHDIIVVEGAGSR